MTDEDDIRDWRAATSADVQQRLMVATEPDVIEAWTVMNRAVVDALGVVLAHGVPYEEAVGMIAGSVAATLAHEHPSRRAVQEETRREA